MSELTDKIRTRGFWLVSIVPLAYKPDRVPYAELLRILERASVDLRGWDFPHLDPHTDVIRDASWIGQESEWNHYMESWRFHQSGHFVDLAAFWDDWRDQSSLNPPEQGWVPEVRLGVGNTIFKLTEIFEFFARFSATAAGDDEMHTSIELAGLKNRTLYIEDHRKAPFRYDRKTSMEKFAFEQTFTNIDLIGRPRELALEVMTQLFERFDWTPGIDRLREWQSQIDKW